MLVPVPRYTECLRIVERMAELAICTLVSIIVFIVVTK